MIGRIALFGEAERGVFCTPYLFSSLAQMLDALGEPPTDSVGIYYAIQALLYDHEIVYFRVEEEGFSQKDYHKGFQLLREDIDEVAAICAPGVGDQPTIEAAIEICSFHDSFLIINDSDFYDYLTA